MQVSDSTVSLQTSIAHTHPAREQLHYFVFDDKGVCLQAWPHSKLHGRELHSVSSDDWVHSGLPPILRDSLWWRLRTVIDTGEETRFLIQGDANDPGAATHACHIAPTRADDRAAGVTLRIQVLPPPSTAHPEDVAMQQMLGVVPTPVVLIRLADWTCLYANAAAAELFGRQRTELIGRDLAACFERSADPVRMLEQLVVTTQVSDFETTVQDSNGSSHAISVSGGCRFVSGNQSALLFLQPGTVSPVEVAAGRDPLTGLMDRNALTDQLTGALRRSEQTDRRVGVLFIDLDEFKEINDRHGHQVGDELLAVIAMRIAGCVRHYESVGRLGGDEFVVILEGLFERNEAARVKRDVQNVVRQPVDVHSCSLSVNATIGIAYAPDDGSSPQELLHLADQAMYDSKRCRREGN